MQYKSDPFSQKLVEFIKLIIRSK